MLFKKKERRSYSAIKLYSVGDDQAALDRSKLLDSILEVFGKYFQEYPGDYDISGPYKIKKGTSVKLNTFKRRIDEVGHEKYYAYDGYTEGRLGFHVLFDAHIGDSLTYTELIIWYDSRLWDVDFAEIVTKVMSSLSLSSGYKIEIDENYNISSETKVKKGLLGGSSLEVTDKHVSWLKNIHNGEYRDIYSCNIWSKNQLDNALSKGIKITQKPIEHLYYVEKY